MREHRLYGNGDGGVDYPALESFAYRAAKLRSELKLCDHCLHENPRCGDSARRRPKHRGRNANGRRRLLHRSKNRPHTF